MVTVPPRSGHRQLARLHRSLGRCMRKLLCRRYHTWISRTCLSLYESNGRDRCWLVVNEGFISGPRRSQSFVGRGRRTPAAGFVRRETRAARRVFVPSARESTVTTREGAKEAPLLLLRAQARTLYVRSCARRRSRARAVKERSLWARPATSSSRPPDFPRLLLWADASREETAEDLDCGCCLRRACR